MLTSATARRAVRTALDREARCETLRQVAAMQRKLHGDRTTPATRAKGVRRFRALARLASLRVLTETQSVDSKLGITSFTRAFLVPGGLLAATPHQLLGVALDASSEVQARESPPHAQNSVRTGVQCCDNTPTLGHDTAPYESGVVRQEAEQADLLSVDSAGIALV